MKVPADRQECIDLLSVAHDPDEQSRLRSYIQNERDYLPTIASLYLGNPFLSLTDAELVAFSKRFTPETLRAWIVARETASRSRTPKIAVFCMPKSGSSFVRSAIGHALELPFATITGFGASHLTSQFGGNSREQEIDEAGIVKSILTRQEGFVCQAHTRYSTYMALQLKRYGLTPVVTVRQILDCIVSFDEMMLNWRRKNVSKIAWISDGPFALPLDYETLGDEDRYSLLTHSYGVWLINFYLSWKRCDRQGLIRPIWIHYEDDVLSARMVETLSSALNMSDSQSARLTRYAESPDPVSSRINVAKKGRGRERIPAEAATWLETYARRFTGELKEDDFAYLFQ